MSVQVKGSGTIGGIDEGLVVSGIVTATQFKLLDNAKAVYGSSADMEIYHNATNSLIQNGTGSLQIITTTGDLFLRGQDKITFNTAGNNQRLQIDSSGKLMLGTTTPSSNAAAYMFTIADPTNSLGNCGITIRSGTGGGSNTNEGSIFFSDATSGSGEYAGYLQYSHVDNYFRIGTSSAERFRIRSDGNVIIGTNYTGGTLSVTGNIITDDGTNGRVTIQADGTSTNQILSTTTGFASYCNMKYQAADHIFLYGGTERMRVKSDGRISINDSSPSSNETLTIRPNGNIACDVSLKMNHSTDSRIKFYDDGGVQRGTFGFTNYANNTTYPNFHDSFYMQTDPSSNGTLATVMRINREGAFMYPKQPCFSVAMSSDYTTSTSHTGNFNTERFDQGDNFNTGSNGIFTAPVTGKYYMHAAIQTMQAGASQAHIMGVSFHINGSVQSSKGSGDQYLGRNGDHYITVHCIRILDLAQGDTVQVYIQLHGQVRIEGSGGTDRCNWQGYLMA